LEDAQIEGYKSPSGKKMKLFPQRRFIPDTVLCRYQSIVFPAHGTHGRFDAPYASSYLRKSFTGFESGVNDLNPEKNERIFDGKGQRSGALYSAILSLYTRRPVALVNATKDSVDPQLGTILTERYRNYIRDKDASSGLSVPEVEEYIAVDSSFTSIIDNDQAKEVLSAVIVQVVDFFE
jgi:hypothetical protein